MQNKKTILASTLAVSALLIGASVNPASAFGFSNLGNGENVRANLSNNENSDKNFELKCGKKDKSDTTSTKKEKKAKKGKDHKCGKDGKCGEGGCGGKM
ncbi:hypothetical protein A9P82_05360 [Arachidicoccus ginsenosidimutans]|uniref:hypothetical protein n=1 Tax=Arachidicoccus sp. BS20 TaxID=1850526 RepID=UPI0007F06D22|nr:hypothetical protein [Arachidicoccus sp. BS20]ANI88764.1 hypothetical protein A9P82_05360 [Arachidicoccus sp. BS20]